MSFEQVFEKDGSFEPVRKFSDSLYDMYPPPHMTCILLTPSGLRPRLGLDKRLSANTPIALLANVIS